MKASRFYGYVDINITVKTGCSAQYYAAQQQNDTTSSKREVQWLNTIRLHHALPWIINI
ncbi:hypothetical protein [Pseudoalteromonas sp. CAL260-MNA-CIBAN-0059]|uniref:hypothetical protein n=1 Tax=unclassified Pseudoalteromonas TaxID=194690 RepID=UPI0033203E85